MGCSASVYILINRSVFAVQGGHFFISLIIALTAVKTIANVSKIITSFILICTPFTNKFAEAKGAEQPPPFLYDIIIS